MAIVANPGIPVAADKPYSSPNRFVANLAAVVALTPQYPGEIVLANDTGIRYRALSAVGNWAQLTKLV